MERSEFEKKQQRQQVTMRTIYNYSMGVLWLGAGIFFLFHEKLGFENMNFDPLVANIFGGACVLYGIFRLYRAYKQKNEG